MPSATPISLTARERLRNHQAVTAKAVAAHSTALARLDAATTRRAAAVTRQDAIVAAANAEVTAAIAEAARVMGADAAAAVLDLSKAEFAAASKMHSDLDPGRRSLSKSTLHAGIPCWQGTGAETQRVRVSQDGPSVRSLHDSL